MTDLKGKIIQNADEAFTIAKAAKNADGMMQATQMLLHVWLEETARYAQVRAPLTPAPDQPETKPGAECLCGATQS